MSGYSSAEIASGDQWRAAIRLQKRDVSKSLALR
jgi:hypothetical protein